MNQKDNIKKSQGEQSPATGLIPQSGSQCPHIKAELKLIRENGIIHAVPCDGMRYPHLSSIYNLSDFTCLQDMDTTVSLPGSSTLNTLDELLARDKQREQDGFPRKINVGRLIKPGKGSKDKIVIVPTTVEEKFMHNNNPEAEEEGQSGGSGEGEEGEVIGQQPVRPSQQGSGQGPGEGGGEGHEIESNAYELGKILTEKFKLPNLKDKGKKRSLTKYTYDMTDRNRGFGQILDKKATLRKIIETNFALDRIPDKSNINTQDLLVSPKDKIYRILSREKDYESQAVVFFVRDYSGSMQGNATMLVASQHVMIYSWLLYQYSNQVETRFILHDANAKEVPDFHTYYNSQVAGGTKISSAYNLVNQIVESENLARDYNIYVFHGTDGDDWDTDGKDAIPELKKMLEYSSRIGITVVKHSTYATQIEQYLDKSGLLKEKSDILRMDTMSDNADENRLIEGIKRLIEDKKATSAAGA